MRNLDGLRILSLSDGLVAFYLLKLMHQTVKSVNRDDAPCAPFSFDATAVS